MMNRNKKKLCFRFVKILNEKTLFFAELKIEHFDKMNSKIMETMLIENRKMLYALYGIISLLSL